MSEYEIPADRDAAYTEKYALAFKRLGRMSKKKQNLAEKILDTFGNYSNSC